MTPAAATLMHVPGFCMKSRSRPTSPQRAGLPSTLRCKTESDGVQGEGLVRSRGQGWACIGQWARCVSLHCLSNTKPSSARSPGPYHGSTYPQATSFGSCHLATVWSRTAAEPTCPCILSQRSCGRAAQMRAWQVRAGQLVCSSKAAARHPEPRLFLPSRATGVARRAEAPRLPQHVRKGSKAGESWSSKWLLDMYVCSQVSESS